jgi:cytochrome P450
MVMFVVEEEDWKNLRTVMFPELRRNIDSHRFIQDMNSCMDILVNKFNGVIGREVELVYPFALFHLSSAAKAMFNVDLHCIEDYPNENKIESTFKWFLTELVRRSFDQDPAVAQDYEADNEDNRKMRAASKVVHDVVLEVVRDRMSKGPKSKRNDMLQNMLEAYWKEFGREVAPEVVESKIGANLVELLFAGYNTVVNIMSSAIYLLTKHPAEMEKVREECYRVLGNRAITADDLDDLPYCDAVFNETLRLYPPAPAVARKITKEMDLGGVIIPEGAECMFAMHGIHNDPSNWKNHDKFMPERMLKTPVAGTFIPFSEGPRSCMGKYFARMEFLVAITTLTRKFHFEMPKNYNFGMTFNGFGWQVSDMNNPMGGRCAMVKLALARAESKL